MRTCERAVGVTGDSGAVWRMPELKQWREWTVQCALGLCAAETRAELRAFVSLRFRHYARKCCFLTNADDPVQLFPSPADAWHLFESRLRLHQSPAGKSYKQWLLARGGEGADRALMESGVSLLVRDVVREYLRREHMPRTFGSLEQPVPGLTGEAVSLRELLPGDADTAATVEQRELDALAETCARDVMDRLSRREQVALLARETGRSITDPAVLQAAGCGKSELSRAYHKALETLASHVRSRFRQEDREHCAAIACATLEWVKALLSPEISWESGAAQSFKEV